MQSAVLPVVPSDSLTLVRGAYSISLLTLLPLVAAMVCAFVLQRRSAGERVLVWRSAVVVLLVACISQFVPFQWRAWIIPQDFAVPLVTIGRAQLALLDSVSPWTEGSSVVAVLAAVYLLVAACVAFPTIRALVRLRRARSVASRPQAELHSLCDDARVTLGLSTSVDVRVSDQVGIPVTWGVIRPVVLLPAAMLQWPRELLRAALIHEFSHVNKRDAFFVLVARLVCAVQWFNPGAWWVSARLRRDTELACDDRVLAAGVRRSDYAELLGRVSLSGLSGSADGSAPALALAGNGGLRERLAWATRSGRRVVLPGLTARMLSVAATFSLSAAISLVELAPTREVLSTLMTDERWDTRAYAVMRLAERSDTVQVARDAAVNDPSPRVRAWARYALARIEATPATVVRPTLD